MIVNSIRRGWEDYASMVIPNVMPGSIQYLETKKAYYTGCWAMFNAMLVVEGGLSAGIYTEEQKTAFLERVESECRQFMEQTQPRTAPVIPNLGDQNGH